MWWFFLTVSDQLKPTVFRLEFWQTWTLVMKNKSYTVGLNWSETVKKNDRKIRWYFWYLWTFLSWPQVIFFKTLFGHQRALQSFFSKLEFWAENFFGHSFYDKNWFYGSVNLLFVQKWVKMAKRSHLQYFSSFIKNLKMSKILKIWSI